jgi:predicted dienelactone hydrolase
VLIGVVALVAGCGTTRTVTVTSRPAAVTSTSTSTATTTVTVSARPPGPPFAVAQRTVTFVDHSRTVRFPGRAPAPRRLVTIVRYPAGASGPFPLIVFGHGFAVTPRPYAALLEAWARAGYVVAAPVFPLENARAPGGPNESDLVNQPRDMSFVISAMLGAGSFAGLLDRHAIAVSGQSDGGETALAVAYDRLFVDRRVRAAAILSGAKIPGVGGFDFPAPSPPLLATQGTADTINPPAFTHAFFDAAERRSRRAGANGPRRRRSGRVTPDGRPLAEQGAGGDHGPLDERADVELGLAEAPDRDPVGKREQERRHDLGLCPQLEYAGLALGP